MKKADVKSRMGYYSELCVAQYLTEEITRNVPDNLIGNSLSTIQSLKEEYATTNLLDETISWVGSVKPNVIHAEKLRQEESGKALAVHMWKDIQTYIKDLFSVDFEVVLTGESGKGRTKADVELFVFKKNTKEIIRKIEASLKVYKGWDINLSNSTFTSFLVNITAPEMGGFANKGSVASKMETFVAKHGNSDNIQRLVELQKFGPAIKREKGREAAKKAVDSNMVYIEARNIIIDTFNDLYKKNKAEINDNMLRLMGLDGTDELYLAVQKSSGQSVDVLSSNASQEFKNIIKNLQNDFRIEFEKSDRIVNTPIRFYSGDTLLFKANLAFRDLDKISVFVNLKKWQ